MPLPNAITAASVKLRFPEFRTLADGLIEFAIEEASLNVDADIYGDWYLTALLYYTAHIVMRGQQTAAGGSGQVIRSMSVGGEISYSFESVTPPTLKDGTDLVTTAYGVRFLEITRNVIPAVAII